MAIHRVSKIRTFAALMVGMMSVVLLAGATPLPPSPGDPHSAAYLGVMVGSVPADKAASLHLKEGSGAAITGVDQDGPACRAGLKSGDIITAFNGNPVEGPEQFASLIHGSAPGSTAAMTVMRDGQSKEFKVTLGDWKEMARMPRPPVPPIGSMGFAAPTPPSPPMLSPRMYPDIEGPSIMPIARRYGIVVEALSPQLCDFFGVPHDSGVLVRSVDKGSLGAAAGLKAGDAIVRVNNETVHDVGEWRRALKSSNGKVTLGIVRDKKEQTVEMSVPANTSELRGGDWGAFDLDMDAMAAEMSTLAQLDQKQIDEINRQAQAAAKAAIPDMGKQVGEARKQADAAMKAATPEMKKQAEALRKQAEEMRKQSEQVRKEIEKMTPQMERDAIQMADAMKPTAKELAAMARDMEKQWKEMQPEFQKQMEQIKKDMEKEKREWQEIFKGSDANHF